MLFSYSSPKRFGIDENGSIYNVSRRAQFKADFAEF